MKAGSLTGLSIGYMLKDWEYDREKGVFLLKEIDLWEVSPVTFPSNDEARVSDVKSAFARGETPSQKSIERVPARCWALPHPGQSIHGRGLWQPLSA